MPVRPIAITRPKLLLGEGEDERRFFNALLAHLGIADIQVEQYRGKTTLKGDLEAFAKAPGFSAVTSLGVTRDADTDANGAFASVCHALINAGLTAPPAHDQSAGGSPRVRVWIMPDGTSPGMLEDLCLSAVQSDPAHPCVDEFFQCVLTRASRQPTNMAKARVHAWLSTQLDPDKRLAEAAEKGYWPWAAPAFQPLIAFLRAL
jgi:hypothetical protein